MSTDWLTAIEVKYPKFNFTSNDGSTNDTALQIAQVYSQDDTLLVLVITAFFRH